MSVMAVALNDLIVRAFQDTDIPNAAAITNEIIEHTAIHFGSTPQTHDEWRAMLNAKSDRHPWLVAELDGGFAGYAKCGTWRERDAYRYTVETSVYIAPSARGRGVGTALYGHLLPMLADLGFHVAVAGMTLPNDASARLHERVGFHHVGVFREVGRKFDTWHDVGFMQRAL